MIRPSRAGHGDRDGLRTQFRVIPPFAAREGLMTPPSIHLASLARCPYVKAVKESGDLSN